MRITVAILSLTLGQAVSFAPEVRSPLALQRLHSAPACDTSVRAACRLKAGAAGAKAEVAPAGASEASSIFNLCKSIMGAGAISLPGDS